VLNRYFRRYSERGLRVVGIDTGDSAEVVRALIGKLNVSYPIASDSGSAANAFRAYAYPTTILIRGDGHIALYKIGSYSEITAI
jgi:peroxiredoxin